MCDSARPDSDEYGITIYRTRHVDAALQRADIQRGYAVVIWRGRHVTEPYELSAAESEEYWRGVMTVARAVAAHFRPLKMNYETLGNTLPHLHTHLLPRYRDNDPRPGLPFPLQPSDGPQPTIPEDVLARDVEALRRALDFSGTQN
ncbi:HIT family protein [Nocardia blacklockiae]|uniref:HIT family protein n=1 Tax=Nocardia blacklockiae TaxID=480036 RepID=UPI0018935A1E|nr:HIT family protein [Nocardia blacklockiae]MBF6172865.1 HIT family protein [Nocardia blacklockiae]